MAFPYHSRIVVLKGGPLPQVHILQLRTSPLLSGGLGSRLASAGAAGRGRRQRRRQRRERTS